MIKKIQLKNFKCFNDEAFNLNKVTLFTGYNGRGKSTVLQSLLLLAQSRHKNGDILKLYTEGRFVDLGSFIELLNDDKNETISINFEIEEALETSHAIELTYELSNDDEFVGKIISFKEDDNNIMVTLGSSTKSSTTEVKSGPSFTPPYLKKAFRDIYYISANRVGPLKYVDNHSKADDYRVGSDGRETINVLASCNDPIDESMIPFEHNGKISLQEGASMWLNYVMDNVQEASITIPEKATDTGKKHASTLSLLFGGQNKFQSYNVGFGYSYILSIIVAALTVPAGSILIIENPEAHLHGQAQSRLTQLLSKLAERGVQVLIETHSEHIVNGFRLAAVSDESKLENTDFGIYFFDSNGKVKPLEMQIDGRIIDWPEGFFSQYQNDLAKIMILGAKKRSNESKSVSFD